MWALLSLYQYDRCWHHSRHKRSRLLMQTSLELSSMWVTHFLSSIFVPIIVFHPVDVLIGTTDVSKHIQK